MSAEEPQVINYGTPFPNIEGDNKKFVPVWKQQAVNDKGHKRFHGAFEGGFSAGFHNTVGSKEGFTPAHFVSSRASRVETGQPAREASFYMDDEDQKEARRPTLSLKLTGPAAKAAFASSRDTSAQSKASLYFRNIQLALSNEHKLVKAADKSTERRDHAFGGGSWDEDDETAYLDDMYSAPKGSDLQTMLPTASGPVREEQIIDLTFGDPIQLTCCSSDLNLPPLPPDFVPWTLHVDASEDISAPTFLESKIDSTEPPARELDSATAAAALHGFLPFAEDPEKQTRYVQFLKRFCGKEGGTTESCIGPHEQEEFFLSAQIFRPAAPVISARFISSKASILPAKSYQAGLSKPLPGAGTQPSLKAELSRSESISSHAKHRPGRSEHSWTPSNLLCKRFGVEPPLDMPAASEKAANALAAGLASELQSKTRSGAYAEALNAASNFLNSPATDPLAFLDIMPARPDDDLFEAVFGDSCDRLSSKRSADHRRRAADFF